MIPTPPSGHDDHAPWPSQRHAAMTIPRGMQAVIASCRACAAACAAVTGTDDEALDESMTIVGDCALTCTALVDLIKVGARLAFRPALAACAEDCRAAAAACAERRWEAAWSECERACLRCAERCHAYARMGLDPSAR